MWAGPRDASQIPGFPQGWGWAVEPQLNQERGSAPPQLRLFYVAALELTIRLVRDPPATAP